MLVVLTKIYCNKSKYYLITPRSRFLPEKRTFSQLANNFPAFYGTRRFITAITSARQLSLSWTRSNPTTYWTKVSMSPIMLARRQTGWQLCIQAGYWLSWQYFCDLFELLPVEARTVTRYSTNKHSHNLIRVKSFHVIITLNIIQSYVVSDVNRALCKKNKQI